MMGSYKIKDLINLLISRIWIIIIITLLSGGLAFSFSKIALPLQYSSHITMYVQSYTGIMENSADANNSISNSKQLVNTYMEVLKDDAVINEVGNLLIKQYDIDLLKKAFSRTDENTISPESIKSCLTITTVTDTSAVNIVATSTDPNIAADICNNLTKIAPKYVEEAVGVGSINTIDTAKVYNTPVGPNTIKIALLGMIAGFLIVILVILIIDYFDNTIKVTDKISEKYNKAIIGEIQQIGDHKKKSEKKNNLDESKKLLTNPNIPFNIAESYKSIRTNVLFTIATSEKKVIAVSSPNPGEGKSTSSANLAIALAQMDSKVLLIDADMRKPVQHKTFKIENSEGLSTLIIQKSTISNSIKNNIIDNLDILTSGPIPPNPSELLTSEQFKKLIEQLSHKYDYIIIDTPPINVVSDAMVIKDLISGILLIMRYASTTYEGLSSCMNQIELAKVNLLGFVLNDVQHKHGSSYYNYKYKYKKYGYGYEQESTQNKENLNVN